MNLSLIHIWHMQMERRQEERRKALEQEASFVEDKGRFFGVEFSDGEICIKVLDSVEACLLYTSRCV